MKSLFILAGLIIGTPLAFAWIESGSPTFQVCVDALVQTSNPAGSPGPNYFFHAMLADCMAEFIDANRDSITALATVLLTIVTGGLVWIAYQQHVTTRAQLRAYVFQEGANLLDATQLPVPGPANQPWVELIIKNSGETPAYNVVHWGNVDVREASQEELLTIPPLAVRSKLHLPPNGFATKGLWLRRNLSPQEVADIQTGARCVFLYGRITYTDAFGRKHFTNYRLRYSGRYPPHGHGTFNYCDEGNTTDDSK